MSIGAIENITDATREVAFGPRAQEVFRLDAAIRWVADAWWLGTRLMELLDRRSEQHPRR
jgi:hypothetical protein